MEARKLDNLSIADYIELEKETNTRYEFHEGTVFAIAGGSIEHGLISGNTFGEIKMMLRNKSNHCRPINSEVKLHIPSLNKFLCPDVMVVCGDIEKSDTEPNSIINPVAIVEVLSKSTESYDRGDKFFFYRQIPSLKEYILIDQYKALIEIYERKSDMWKITRVEGLGQKVEIACLGIALDLKNIYEDVVFENHSSGS